VQRPEAIHSAVVQFCSKQSSVVKLMKDMEKMVMCQRMKAKTAALTLQFKSLVAAPGHTTMAVFPPAQRLANSLEQHPSEIVLVQAGQFALCDCRKKEEAV